MPKPKGQTSHFKVDLYDAVPGRARFVALWWETLSVPERDEMGEAPTDHNSPKETSVAAIKTAIRKLPQEPGLYAITGSHDAHHGEGVLYVGQATRLNERVLASAVGRLYERHGDGAEKLCADVWSLTVRWARLARRLLNPVEKLLIMSHMPPFNSQAVSNGARRKGPLPSEFDLVIMSAGRKGPLLPVVAGAYQASWKDIRERRMGSNQEPPRS